MVPYKNLRTIDPDGSVAVGSSVALSGHTVIQAESVDQAIEYAKSCPFLEINGTLEVAELVKM